MGGYVEDVGGGAALTYATGAGPDAGQFVWPTNSTIEKTLTLTLVGAGPVASCRLVPGGDDDAFEITEIKGIVLPTPRTFDWLLANDPDLLDIAFESATTTLKIRPTYPATGVYQMTLDVENAAGVVVTSGLTADSESSDGLLTACEDEASLIALWSPHALTPGSLASGATAMQDISVKSAVDLKVQSTAPGHYAISATSPGTIPSMQQSVQIVTRASTSYVAAATDLAAVVKSGFSIYSIPGASAGTWYGCFAAGGKIGTPSANGTSVLAKGSVGTNYIVNNNGGGGSGNIPVGASEGVWLMHSWRRIDGGDDYHYVSLKSGSWKGIGSSNTLRSTAALAGWGFGYYGNATAGANWLMGPQAAFSTILSEADLEDLFDAFKAG